MIIQVLKNNNYASESDLPKQATDRSTGLDIIATSDPIIIGPTIGDNENKYHRIEYIEYKTNLKIAVQKDKQIIVGIGPKEIDYDVFAMPRSSVSKYNLILANGIGLIDADYRGEVSLRFKYVWQPEDLYPFEKSFVGIPNLDKVYKKGDKICQLKVTKVEHVILSLVDVLDSTARGEGGFGSTTKEADKEIISRIVDKYKENPVQTPVKKYSELMKEIENKL